MNKTVEDIEVKKLYQLIQGFETIASNEIGKAVKLHPIIMEGHPTFSVDHIVILVKNVVARICEIDVDIVDTKSTKRIYSEPRAICYKLIRWASEIYSSKISLKSIGNIFNGRDHTTIVHALNLYDDLYKTNAAFKSKSDRSLSLILQYIQNRPGMDQSIKEYLDNKLIYA